MSFFSKIKLKNILSQEPVSSQFGCDRGTPLDRYYIEKFLRNNSQDIKGDVVEIAEDTYSKKFGKNIRSKILHVESNTQADLKGDLCNTATLPDNYADCFICTQTFNFIYNFQDAIKGSRYMLKPGGTLLATVACMAPISKYDADRWGDYWRFTPQSCKKIFGDAFGENNIQITPYGNSAVAALFMKGYAIEDLPKSVNLDHEDELFPVVIGIKAVK